VLAVPGTARRVVLAHALAALGMSLPWPLLLVLVRDRVAGSPQADLLLGLTGAARLLPYVLLSWATGTLADRFPRHVILRLTILGRAVLLVVVAAAVAEGRLGAAVGAAALTVGCGTPAYPAAAAAMPELAGTARRRATDLLVTVEVASFVVGPAVGGLLLAPSTRGWTLPLALASTLAASALLRGVRLPLPSGRSPRTGMPLAVVRVSGRAARAVTVAGLLNAVVGALALVLLPLAAMSWSGGDRAFGLATGVLGFGALAAPLLCRLGRTALSRVRWGLLLMGGTLLLLASTPSVAWALAPLALVGAVSVHVESALTETIQDAVPDGARAGVLGLTDTVMVAAALLGSLVAPWLSSALGPRAAVLLLAGVGLGGLTLVSPPAVTAIGYRALHRRAA
jgi:MFS family permease